MTVITGDQLAKHAKHLAFDLFPGIDLGKSQIIWAPNGTGKSSIFKAIRGLRGDSVTFADVDSSRESFKDNGQKLIVGLGIQSIESLERENARILKEVNPKKKLRSYGISTQKDAKRIFGKQYERCTTDAGDTFARFDQESVLRLLGQIDASDVDFVIRNYEELRKSVYVQSETELLKDRLVGEALRTLRSGVDEKSTKCPVCGYDYGIACIAQMIDRRLSDLGEARDCLSANYHALRPELTLAEVEKGVARILQTGTTPQQVIDLCLCEGDSEKCNTFGDLAKKYRRNEKQIAKKKAENERFFNNLKGQEEKLRILFVSRFQATSVEMDDRQKRLVVTLPRKVETYSTGEINLMLSLIRISEFIASDRSTLIFDDPLSSLDKANQYFVLFELIKLADDRQNDKNVLMMTHNLDCIAIAESQHRRSLPYFCMERVGNKVFIDDIPTDFFDVVKDVYKKNGAQGGAVPGSICAESLVAYAKEAPTSNLSLITPYIELMMQRDVDDDPAMHAIFHWRGPAVYAPRQLSNEFLVRSIDRFDPEAFIGMSFVERGLQKIFLLASLRVWVERRIYLDHKALLDSNSDKHSLGAIVQLAFKGSNWHGPAGVSREFLNSKKTMLNQGAHEKAQSAPFDFSLNLSANDICQEITEIKEAFGPESV